MSHASEGESKKRAATGTSMAIAALGVVYGDIGTSPLYAVKECFTGEHGAALTEHNVLGIVSLIFWSLTAVVVMKYLTFVMQADHDGEGGILALLALVTKGKPAGTAQRLDCDPRNDGTIRFCPSLW